MLKLYCSSRECASTRCCRLQPCRCAPAALQPCIPAALQPRSPTAARPQQLHRSSPDCNRQVRLHHRLRRAHSAAHAVEVQRAALRHVLATHEVLRLFSFALPQLGAASCTPSAPAEDADAGGATGGATGGGGGGGEQGGGSTCAWVAALWPLIEGELHAVLKELIRLHTAAAQPELAARVKQLYRLSLTQREILGTGMLPLLAAESGSG